MLKNSTIKNIVKKYGSPIYIYDRKVIIEIINMILAIPYPEVKIFAATMANNNPELLKIYKEHNIGAFVNSIKHLRKVKGIGFSGKEIMWTSTGMNIRQMKAAINEGTI